MRFSRGLFPTLKENPQEADCKSHRLMIRAGLIRKLASGTYSYLPLGLRVLQKIERVIREEMNRAGALEVLLPALHPAEIWKETGRYEGFGENLFRVEDRHGRENVLGPTHEEIITDLARREVKSYRQLPLMLYQIQTKFRDEARPRSGVIRSREFIMKDAYSFHATPESLDETYERMKKTYCRIFERCGLQYYIVEADSGVMGGSGSQEFVLFSDAGEDRMVRYGDGDRVVSAEMVFRRLKGAPKPPQKAEARHSKIHTPNCSSVESVVKLINEKNLFPPHKVSAADLVKTMIYERPGGKPFAVIVRGDHDVSEYKVRKTAPGAYLASKETIHSLGSAFGYSGPFGLNGIDFLIDEDVLFMKDFVAGANEKDQHVVGVNVGDILTSGGRDGIKIGDFRPAVEGDEGEENGRPVPLSFHTAIELGHIFKLGLRYSEPMKAVFLDEKGKEHPMIMGCYGIGVNRIAAAAIEQGADDKGVIWPAAISPFEILVLPLTMDDPETRRVAGEIYEGLAGRGREVLIDDREASAGIKLNDADLLGIPVWVVIGSKSLKSGCVEVRTRKNREAERVAPQEAVTAAEKLLDTMK